MSVKQWQPRKMPDGYKSSGDFVREIEAADGLRSTGWHYAEQPTPEEVAYKSRVHHNGAELFVREIPGSLDIRPPSWTLFIRVVETLCLPVDQAPQDPGDWRIVTVNVEFNKWERLG